MEQGGVRVPEDGDELVRVDLRFDRAERRVATLVCERGAHCRGGGGKGAGKGKRTRQGRVLRRGAADATVPCTRQTSLCTRASANFRWLGAMDDGEDCVEEVGMDESGVACTAVAIVGERGG